MDGPSVGAPGRPGGRRRAVARSVPVAFRPMDSPAPPFSGVGVALVTLFDADGEIDASTTARHASHLVDRGIRGVLVAGSTGEAAALDADER